MNDTSENVARPTDPKYCRCSDPENCTEAIPGYICKAGLTCDPDYEPPEPDGEDFRGGEAAAYSAEEQARIQRELK